MFLNDKSRVLASYVVSGLISTVYPHHTPPSTTSSQRWTRSPGTCPAISFVLILSLEHITSACHQPKVAVALGISSAIVTLGICYATALNAGLPILHESRRGSALWKWLRKIPEALRPLVAALPIPLLPGCHDNPSDMQIETPCVVTMGMCSTEWHGDTDSLMLGCDTRDPWCTCSHMFHSHRQFGVMSTF